MATAPLRICSYKGCSTLIPVGKQRCASHQKKSWEGARGNSYGPEWPALRLRVIREERFCRNCRVRRTVEVDHIKPVSEGGTHDRQNLQGLCRRCSSIKTTREAARAAAAKRSTILRRVESNFSTQVEGDLSVTEAGRSAA